MLRRPVETAANSGHSPNKKNIHLGGSERVCYLLEGALDNDGHMQLDVLRQLGAIDTH